MIKYLAVSLVIASGSVTAGQLYVGAGGGVVWTDLNDSGITQQAIDDALGFQLPFEASNDTSSLKFAYRAHVGFMLVEYLGVEIGYANYGRSTSDDKLMLFGNILDIGSKNTSSAFDLLAVVRVPVFNELSVHGKAGVAYVSNKYQLDASLNDNDSIDVGSNKSTNIRPKLGAGASLNVYEQFYIDVDYEVTFKNGEPYSFSDNDIEFNNSYSPLLQMVTLGVRYEF